MSTLQKTCLVLTLLLLPGLATATHLTEVTINGDCEGWTATVNVHFRSTVYEADLDFDIVLFDAEGVELERFRHETTVTRDGSTPHSTIWRPSTLASLHAASAGNSGAPETIANRARPSARSRCVATSRSTLSL